MIVDEIPHNIITTKIACIAHSVNCQNTMSMGVAKSLYTKFPEIKTEYHKFCTSMIRRKIDRKKLLGNVQAVKVNEKQLVFNCFTQYNFGTDGIQYVDYGALRKCFMKLVRLGVKELAIPQIGCGLAGGNWEIVKKLINNTIKDDMDVYVYVFYEG